MNASKPLLELELRPVEAPAGASAGACVYVLLPSLEELLDQPGFGCHAPICLPRSARPFDPLNFFAARPQRAETLH
jgi:hypothetical protein